MLLLVSRIFLQCHHSHSPDQQQFWPRGRVNLVEVALSFSTSKSPSRRCSTLSGLTASDFYLDHPPPYPLSAHMSQENTHPSSEYLGLARQEDATCARTVALTPPCTTERRETKGPSLNMLSLQLFWPQLLKYMRLHFLQKGEILEPCSTVTGFFSFHTITDQKSQWKD